MGSLSNLVSNGTCYTAAGEKLNSEFIPCGNAAFGYQTCCGAGDTCLADLACFGVHGQGYGSYLTYFGGCTDPNYKDGSCPKKQIDQPWVALTLCDNSDEWGICSQPGNPATLQPGATCTCTDASKFTIAFKDSTKLAALASLPQSTGGTISFYAGHSPTDTVPTAGATAQGTTKAGGSSPTIGAGGSSSSTTFVTTMPGGSVATVTATIMVGNGTQSSSSQGHSTKLATGAIVGIAVGAVVVIAFLVLMAFFLGRRRRRQPQTDAEVHDAKVSKLSKKQRESDMSTSSPSMPEADGFPVAAAAPIAEVKGTPAEPWVLRSELDGTQVDPSQHKAAPSLNFVPSVPVAELPGSSPPSRGGPKGEMVEDAMVAPLSVRPRHDGPEELAAGEVNHPAAP